MSRITFERKIGEVDFVPRIHFYKDNIEFARISMELIQDLTMKYPESFPFRGPEFTLDEAYNEILHCLKYELNDPTLNEELEEVLKNLKNSDTNTK